MRFDLIDVARQHVETGIASPRTRQRPRADQIRTKSSTVFRSDSPHVGTAMFGDQSTGGEKTGDVATPQLGWKFDLS